jgi:predicted GNAT family acetyltransferase
MSDAVTAQLIRRPDSRDVIEYLARDPLPNLLLLELASRLGQATTAGEMRSEAAVARRGGEIIGVMGLRPTVVLDAAAESEAIVAFLPLLEAVGTGLIKCPVGPATELWDRMCQRAARSTTIDRREIAYLVRPDDARLLPTRDRVPARLAQRDDLEPLVIAARESLREEGRPDPFEGDVRGFRRWVRGRSPRARVIESEGRVVFVGYADVRRSEGWLLQGVYTWPEYRKQGFATAGVSDLCREAFEADADHVQLAVVEGNVAGHRLYERLGFQPFTTLRTILFMEA